MLPLIICQTTLLWEPVLPNRMIYLLPNFIDWIRYFLHSFVKKLLRSKRRWVLLPYLHLLTHYCYFFSFSVFPLGFHRPLYFFMFLGILLSRFSRVWLFETPWTIARQVPPSIGFSGQEYRSGLPSPPSGDLPYPRIKPMSLMSPMSPSLTGRFLTTSATWKNVSLRLKLPILWEPMTDCSPPGSSVPGIFQARILEWVAISYSREFS